MTLMEHTYQMTVSREEPEDFFSVEIFGEENKHQVIFERRISCPFAEGLMYWQSVINNYHSL